MKAAATPATINERTCTIEILLTLLQTYQSNLTPIRAMRGPMIFDGERYVVPEFQLMFCSVLALVML
jgi:hypothetical protein